MLLVALAGALARGAVGSSTSVEGIGWTVTSSPFRLVLTEDDERLTSAGGTAAPLAYVTADGVEHRLTDLVSSRATGSRSVYRVATDEPGRHATLEVSHRAGGVAVRWRFDRPAGIASVRVALAASTRDHFLGTGQRTRWVDVRQTVQPLKVWATCESSSPSAFFASSGGLGAVFRTQAVGRIAFPGVTDDANFACELGQPPCPVGPAADAVRVCLKSPEASFELAAGSPEQLVEWYSGRVGRPRAPWLPQLSLIKWRDTVEGPHELLDDIEQLRSRGLPIGWVILDNPWEAGASVNRCYGSLTFDPVRYPDPKGMIDAVHAKGVRFMLWISPQFKSDGCTVPSFPDGWLTGDDRILVRDLTRPETLADFEAALRRLVALGVDGFKGDRADELDIEDATLAGGPGTRVQQQLPLLYQAAAARAMGGKPFGSLFRAFVPGSSRLLGGMIGPDRPQTFAGLTGAIRAAQTAGVSGAPVWGSDIGGYAGGTLTPVLFARWAQFAALTPIFEVGGDGLQSRFWELGTEAVEAFRDAATLHYELVPELYALAQEASRTGLPVVRPLGLTWHRDDDAWANDLELTVGRSLLAAPVTVEGDASGRATTSVYLPGGSWVDLGTGRVVEGRRTLTRTSGLRELPLYLLRGSSIAYNARTPRIWAKDWSVDDLLRKGRQGWLVAPLPGTTSRATDRGTRLTADTARDGTATVTIVRALPEQQVLVVGAGRTCRVEVDGRAVPRRTPRALRTTTAGWTVEPSGRRAVVVKIGDAARATILTVSPCRA